MEVELVLARLSEMTGLDFDRTRQKTACRVIAESMSHSGLGSAGEFINELETNWEMMDGVVDKLTVGESYLFRFPEQFEILESKILPELAARRNLGAPMRLWSAGCSHGPEAVSLALLLDRLHLLERSWLLATDLSTAAIERAKSGLLSKWDLRGDSNEKWCRLLPQVDGHYLVPPKILAAIEYRRHNLANDDYPGPSTPHWGLDLIFCRNVLIYFTDETIEDVARRLFDSLCPGGYLVTAPTDPDLTSFAPYEKLANAPGFIYRRPTLTKAHLDLPIQPKVAAAPERVRPFTPAPPGREKRIESLGDAQIAFYAGDWERALTLLEGAEGRAADLLYLRALSNIDLMRAGDHGQQNADSRCPEFHYLTAVIEMANRRYQNALRAARKSLLFDPDFIMAHHVIATSWDRLNQPDRAEESLKSFYRQCSALPADQLIPYADGRSAGQLASDALTILPALAEHGETR